jgi:hypothetical protein
MWLRAVKRVARLGRRPTPSPSCVSSTLLFPVCACGISPQILTAKVLLQGLRQLAGLEHKAEGLVAMLGTPVGRYRAALSLAPLLCLYWPKVALDTSATKVGMLVTHIQGPFLATPATSFLSQKHS